MSKPKGLKIVKYGTKSIVTIPTIISKRNRSNFLCKQNYYTNGFVNISLYY